MDKLTKISIFGGVLGVGSLGIYKFLTANNIVENIAAPRYKISDEARRYLDLPVVNELQSGFTLGETIDWQQYDNKVPGVDWGGVAFWSDKAGLKWQSNGTKIIAWFKGCNVHASGWNVHIFYFEIKKFLETRSAVDHWKVKIGEFL